MRKKTMIKKLIFYCFLMLLISSIFVFFEKSVFASSTDGTIDSAYKYAWGENIGWANFGTSSGNVHVTDSGLSGYALSETVGWIYLGDVTNDGQGNLSGYAWSENAGWIKFNPDNGGVVINSSGEFTGSALGENIGWMIFDGDYTVKTDWRPRSARPACNNSSDDDGDGKTDYPNDPGCDSLTDADETDPSGGGGGLPAGAGSVPSSPSPSSSNPSGSFQILINNGVEYTNSRMVVLKMITGSDSKKMAVSANADLQGGSGQVAFEKSYNWDLCYLKASCPDGEHIVYGRFYTEYGQPSETVSDTILLDATPPEIDFVGFRDFYSPAEDVVLSGKTEKNSEVILHWDGKYGFVSADANGDFKIKLGKQTRGVHHFEITVTDQAGNKSNSTFDLNIIDGVPSQSVSGQPELKEKESVFKKLEPFIPEFLKPEKPEEEQPEEEMIIIPENAPAALLGQWNLMPQSVERFVLAPLPKEIRNLAQKFPKLEKTFEEVGINKITDIAKLKTAKLTLPGLTERAGLSTTKVEPGKFALFQGVPIADLSPSTKQQLPAEIVFARTGDELIDFNIALSVTEKGEPQQRINTISGKPLRLVVKPGKPVKSVKGYLVFKSKSSQSTSLNLPTDSLLASLFFADPVFAKPQEQPVRVEEKLVLLEFEYTDPDGDGIYTAEIQAPLIEGEYEVITVMDFDDPELGKKEIRLITVIDPEGYIYEKDDDKGTRIPGAIISLFWLNPETKQYEVWPAGEYQQENPQTTDVRGTYSFLVPEGYYYLKAEAPGYLVYDGKPFQVKEGSGIHINVELKTKYWWLKIVDWKTVLLVLAIVLLFYNFYRDKIRERLAKSKNI